MSKILDRLPILPARKDEPFGERHARVRRNQILVWVSVHLKGILQPETNTPRVPALLDTGNNFDFSSQHRHLREWAGLDPSALPYLGQVEINDRPVDRYGATVWLHPNVPGTRTVRLQERPHLLEMPRGIAVYARDADPLGPRLPLLGLPALLHNDLDLFLDPELRQVTVQTRTWRRQLMRLLARL